MTNIREKITYFKDKNCKSKKNQNKMLTTILKSFDTFVNIASTTSSITLSLTGNSWVGIPTSTGIACGLTISNKVIYEIVMQKYKKYNKHYEKDQQTIKSFDKSFRRSLQGNITHKSEYESQCNIFNK